MGYEASCMSEISVSILLERSLFKLPEARNDGVAAQFSSLTTQYRRMESGISACDEFETIDRLIEGSSVFFGSPLVIE